MFVNRRTNLPRNKRRKRVDVGEFETTSTAFRQHVSQASSSSNFGEDTLSSDKRRIKHRKVNIPMPQPLQEHPDPPLPDLPALDFSNVPDLQWKDNAPVDEDSDEDELEDDAQKARRYSSSVCSLKILGDPHTNTAYRMSLCVSGCRSAPNL